MSRRNIIASLLLRAFCHITLVLCPAVFLLLSGPSRAVDTVAVLLSERDGYYSEYFEALSRSLGEASPSARPPLVVELLPGRERPDEAVLAGINVIVAVGVQAMRAVAAWENTPPVLNVLVPRASYDKLLAETGRGRSRGQFSAIYLDQPLTRQLNLVQQVLPGKRRISVLLGPDSAFFLPRLRAAVARSGMEIFSEEVSREPQIIPALSRLLNAGDVLLALPDSIVFTRDTARSVLLTTYRHQKPLIGFSQGYVNAGALAAVFSTPAQIAQQSAELLRTLPPGRTVLPAPRYPAYFSVAVNRSVARALVLDIPTDASLQSNLSRMPEGE